MIQKFLFSVDLRECLWTIGCLAGEAVGFFVLFYFVPEIKNQPFLLLLCICPIFIVQTIWLIIKIFQGVYLTTEWFRQEGIHIEARFEKVEKTYDYMSAGTVSVRTPRCTLFARGIQNNQLYKAESLLCPDTTGLNSGDVIIVHLHPKRPRWAYRIDLAQRTTMSPQQRI